MNDNDIEFPSNQAGIQNPDDREIMDEQDIERLKTLIKSWYDVEFEFRLKFPEHFNEVPALYSVNRVWDKPVTYRALGQILRQENSGEGPSQLPEEILRYFNNLVDSASDKFADMQKRLNDNEHHINVLERAKAIDKIPNFLKPKIPTVKFFPEDSAVSLRKSYEEMQLETSKRMLERTLRERYILRAKLYQEAGELQNVVELEARTKWIEAQGERWNAWDQLYPVSIQIEQDGNVESIRIPLSASIFSIAMQRCNSKVSALMQAKLNEKAEERQSRTNEQKLRNEALAQISALPRPDVEKSLERRFQDMMKPLEDEIRSLKEELRGNPNAPKSADTHGAASTSAKKSHASGMNHCLSEKLEAPLDTQPRKKRKGLPRRSGTAMVIDTVPRTHAGRADQAREPGSEQRDGKRWGRKGKFRRGSARE